MPIRFTQTFPIGPRFCVTLAAAFLLGTALETAVYAQIEPSERAAKEDFALIKVGTQQDPPFGPIDWNEPAPFGDRTAVTMSLTELKSRLRQHPSLQTYAFSASADRLRADSALALPDPVVSFQLNNIPLLDPSFTEYLPSNKAVGVQQSLPSRASRKAQALKSSRLAEQAEIGAQEHYARIEGRVFALIISRQSLLKRRDLIETRLEKYDELKDIIDIEISAGRPLLYRLSQIDVERADAERELTNIDQDITVIDSELISWVGTIPDIEQLDVEKVPLTGNAMQFHAVRLADASVEIREADVRKAEAEFEPDWGVNLTYQQRESGKGFRSNFDGEDWVSGGVSFSLPLWAGKRQTPNLKAAKSDRQAAMLIRTARAREARAQWRQYDAKRDAATANIQTLRRKLEALEEQSEA